MHKSPDPGVYQRVSDEVIVKFKSGVTDKEIDDIYNEVGVKIKRSIHKHGKFKVLKFNKNKTVDEVIAKLNKSPKVEYAEENSIGYAQMTTSDNRRGEPDLNRFCKIKGTY